MSAGWVTVENHGEGWMLGCRLCGDETYQPPGGSVDQAMEGVRNFVDLHAACRDQPAEASLQGIEGEPPPAWRPHKGAS